VEKAIKVMRDKKGRWNNDIPGDGLKLLGDDDLKIMTQLINNMYETGEWPRDFNEVTISALKKKLDLRNAGTIAQSASSHIEQRE
jgi:hypothetical protein